MNPPKILVVDDEAGMIRAVQRVLEKQYTVRCCGLPSEALATVADWTPDLALLDIRMPEMSGFELLEILQERCPMLDTIMMTGSVHELDAHMVRALRANAYYFIEKPFDREVLLTLVERCIQQRELEERNRQHVERLERELMLARHFQHSLLPPTHLQHSPFELWARYEPCDEMAGDLFDYVAYNDDSIAVLVADVAGHGVSAAMQTGVVKSAFRACRESDFDPAVVVRHVLRHMKPFPAGRFLTLFTGRISTSDDRFEYVNAGHPSALLWGRAKTLTALDPTGPLVSSAWDDLSWDKATVSLDTGDHLFIYTDGIDEAHTAHEQFGQSRIEDGIRQHSGGGPALLDGLLGAVKTFVGDAKIHDDLTLVTLARQ